MTRNRPRQTAARPARRREDLPRTERQPLRPGAGDPGAVPRRRADHRSGRTGTSPGSTATRGRPRTGSRSSGRSWSSGSARGSRSGPTGGRPTSSPRPMPTGAPWRVRTVTSRGARGLPTRSARSSTSTTCSTPSSATSPALGPKLEPNQVDPVDWVYDIGENGDCGVDALISDNVRDYVDLFRRLAGAKGSFATKFVNRDLLDYDPRGGTRIRFSLMPQRIARVVDIRTSPIAERIAAIDAVRRRRATRSTSTSARSSTTKGGSTTTPPSSSRWPTRSPRRARAQLRAEVIFLTHNDRLHEVNMRLAPEGRRAPLGARPPGGEDLRDRRAERPVPPWAQGGAGRPSSAALLRAKLPECQIRYAF